MYRFLLLSLLSLCIPFCTAAGQFDARDEIRLLVFSKTVEFRHESIEAGIQALREIGMEEGYAVDHTEDATLFSSAKLEAYDAVIFLNTTGDVLNELQQQAFTEYIQNGGGFIGIHSATDTEYEWPWYNRLVGAYFVDHPPIQEATIQITDNRHAATRHLPERWTVTDEWYNFSDIQPHINVIARLDESTYEGGENGEFHPVAWYHEFEGGRSFYTGRGHTPESFSEPLFRRHLLGGIRYATGQ